MTQAGWYPDPAGAPQTYRYWDGSRWSQQTSSDPYAPPPAATAPPPPPPVPPAFSPQPYAGGYPPSPATGPRRTGLAVLLVVGAVLVLVGLSVGGFLGYRALTDDGDDDAGGGTSVTDTATTTDAGTTATTESVPTTPTETGSAGVETTDRQCGGGRPAPASEPDDGAARVSGGGLTIPVPQGYVPDVSYADQFTWADDFVPVQKVIEQTDQSGWVSIYGVGGLSKGNGFTDLEQAAEVVMSCMAQSPDLYHEFSGRQDLSSGEITVDGSEAYQITAELRVDDPELTVEGDVAQVVVVDTGDAETFGLYLTVVPIGDQALVAEQEAAVARIRVG